MTELIMRLIIFLTLGGFALYVVLTGNTIRGRRIDDPSLRIVASLFTLAFGLFFLLAPKSWIEAPQVGGLAVLAVLLFFGWRIFFLLRPRELWRSPGPLRRKVKYANTAVALSHPANAGVIAYLDNPFIQAAPSGSPEGADPWHLGTHPDLVEIIWDKLPVKLPENCQGLVYGRPALVHPKNGLIFGIAAGSWVLALRLPEAERRAVSAVAPQVVPYSDGTRLVPGKLGDDWAFIPFTIRVREQRWCLRAYEYTGQLT